jgi:hypothetical protein
MRTYINDFINDSAIDWHCAASVRCQAAQEN